MPAYDWYVDPKLPVMAIVTPRDVFMCGIYGRTMCDSVTFIYGGPFTRKASLIPFVDTITPVNVQLQGLFQQSFAYYTIKDRLPVIITKVIDLLSREQDSIIKEYGSTQEDITEVIKYCTKLKNDIMTNKQLEPLKVQTEEAEKWNKLLIVHDRPYYFTAVWIFTECYVYRRLREAFELSKTLTSFDPFRAQKDTAFVQNLEAMCVVANTMVSSWIVTERGEAEENDKRKKDFVTLLKVSLWANKCDLSLTAGAHIDAVVDPLLYVEEFQDKVLVDESENIAKDVIERAKKLRDGGETNIVFDIICDNAGYEVYTDLCLAHFLVARNIVDKVRFHLKQIPWFVSDVMSRDFTWVIDNCAKAEFNKVVRKMEEDVESSTQITSDNLKTIGRQWKTLVENGTFEFMAEEFWTSPHIFKDMRTEEPDVYRDLQPALAILFKGDLNYRKLLGERNWNSVTSFDVALEGFHPAPLIAVRTVKADLICGLPKGKWKELQEVDEKWMEKGDYGVIQYCTKVQPLPADIPVQPPTDTAVP